MIARFTSLFFFVALSFSLIGQKPFKTIADHPFVQPKPLQVTQQIHCNVNAGRLADTLTVKSLVKYQADVASYRVMTSGSIWIEMKPNHLWSNRAAISDVVEQVVGTRIQKAPWALEWAETSRQTDQQNQTHIRVQQTLAGKPIKGQDMILHLEKDELKSLNGFAWTGSLPEKLPNPIPESQSIEAAIKFLQDQHVRFATNASGPGLDHLANKASLIWIPVNGKLVLAYLVELHPNALDHWTVYVNAGTLEIMQSISETCTFAPMQLFKHVPSGNAVQIEKEDAPAACLDPLDGATVTTDQDLLNQNRTVNAYQVGSTFFMIDASRTTMFQPAQSVMPNEPLGVIWTVDAQNSSPQQNNFEVFHVSNANNNWKNLEVSAHYNAGQAFEYYRNTFNRNSINGEGGNIVSIINVTDENDNNMDNAFWNGSAMFYGNGDVAFLQLAKGLDVAGHEMSHGVVGSTANLEYVSQSGALNESYADVFGSLIDREDYKIGEDVVKTNVFPSGALRDLSNPHNGGNGPNDNGWQPAHMSEYQNLPVTPEGDNGGVHVNSGIPNKAYFLVANTIGKEKAEHIYYKALTDYLTKSSQFIDMRNAAELAAKDLHGANSAEVIAVRNAFDQVGIGAGQGDNPQDDIETNTGDDFVIATDESESDLYIIPPSNPSQFVKMNVPAPISRPSFTDDGTSFAYVDNTNNMVIVNFDWSQGLHYDAFYLEQNPQGIWRNVVVSKDGTKVAFTTSNLVNEINVFDFTSGGSTTFTLYNPTTAEGIETGDVLYPDAMEWDYSGEFIMYDALNRIESSFGDGIEYWDISFLNAWDNQANNFPEGLIQKLYNTLPENVSVGNPSFAKNSPYIITFDFAEDYFDNFGDLQTDYWVIAANIETGEANNIFHNTTVGYPNYSKLDDKILFTFDDNGALLLATIGVQSNKILPEVGSEIEFISGAQKGVWFVVGQRDITSVKDILTDADVTIQPQPASDVLRLAGADIASFTNYAITELSGKVLRHAALQTSSEIDISLLSNGMYIIQLFNADGKFTVRKFVKH